MTKIGIGGCSAPANGGCNHKPWWLKCPSGLSLSAEWPGLFDDLVQTRMKIPRIIRRVLNPLIYNRGFAIIPPRVNPVWPQRQFLKRLLNKLDVDCVFDVGANVGQYATELRNLGYHGLILSFEPDPACFSKLAGKAAGDQLWKVYNVALGSASGSAKFNVMEVPLFNSFRTPTTTNTATYAGPNAVKETIEVAVQTLEELYPALRSEHGFHSAFLKMDTQGFDNEVFIGAGNMMSLFVGMQSEVAIEKLYENTLDWKEAISLYQTAGLKLAGLFAVNADKDELIELDCYFVCPVIAENDRRDPA